MSWEIPDPLDLNQYHGSQLIAEILPEVVERIQPLYSRQVVITGKILEENRKHHPEMGMFQIFAKNLLTLLKGKMEEWKDGRRPAFQSFATLRTGSSILPSFLSSEL